MDTPSPLPSYSYSKKSNNTGVKFYGIKVAKKLVNYSLHHISVSGGPSLCFRVFLEITSLSLPIRSWHRRVLLSTTSPPKPPFPLSSSAKGLIVRDRQDKRLRFSVLTCDCFPLDLLLS